MREIQKLRGGPFAAAAYAALAEVLPRRARSRGNARLSRSTSAPGSASARAASSQRGSRSMAMVAAISSTQ